MITSYNYEGKIKEEVLKNCLNELNVPENDLYIKEELQESGLFKSKKIKLICYKKEDIIEYLKNYINDIAKGMNISINTEIRESEGYISIILVSDNNSILIGKEGTTLKAIETILKQALIVQTGLNIKVNLDVANYKGKKIKNFERQIKLIINDVLKSHIDVKLDPMNSYERRIVHNLVSENEFLSTESVGEEPNRAVVIKYNEK